MLPSGPTSVNEPSVPQPMKTLPSASCWTFPIAQVVRAAGARYSSTSDARFLVMSSVIRIPRDSVCAPGTAALLSKIVIVPSGRRRTSCWNANDAAGSTAKSLFIPPRRQSTSPLLRSIL